MKLRVSRGAEILSDVELDEGEYVIGSGDSAHLRIDSDLIAPEHARLRIGAGGVEVEDLGSEHGTWIGELLVVGVQPLPGGSFVQFGDIALQVREDESPAAFTRSGKAAERFVIGPVVASGAMGVIRSAREVNSGREVAMKQMKPGIDDPNLIARFVQEARITAHLEHPNVVPVHEVNPGTEGSHYYTMKMVRGESLEEVVALLETRAEAALKAYPLETLLTIFQKVCDALAFAHSKGVIHRDLKPANIMVGKYGEVLVMDWGLAKLAGEAAAELVRESPDIFAAEGSGATMAGSILGTARYMSPEQASGDTEWVDERSDVYALGAILYRLLTLRPPVEGRGTRGVLAKVRAGAIVPPLERVGAEELPHLPEGRIPASLAAVTMKAMSLSPERRYQRVQDLQAEIRAYQTGFATEAEGAGAMRQFALLLKRHKGVATAIAASLLLLAGSSAFYTVRLMRARNDALANEVRANQNAEAARVNEEVAKKAQRESADNARLAEENAARATANAKLAGEREAIALAAEEKMRVALDDKLRAEGKTVLAEEKQTMAETTAKTAVETAQQKSMEATAAQAAADLANTNRLTQRIASLPAETDAAALAGDAGTVLVNSVFQLERERDPNHQQLLRRRIGTALHQMPRLLYLKDGAQLARISPNGSIGVFFEGSKGMLINTAAAKTFGLPLNHGPKGTAEAVEFGSDSRFLLSVGTTSPGVSNVWMWDATNGTGLTLPRWNLEGNLERFLPYPDRSRVVTVHAVPKTKKKEINLWTLDGATPAARVKTPQIDGMVCGLVPLARTAQFLLQSFNIAVGESGTFVHRMEASSVTLRCDPVRDPTLASASAISPDGSRAVQLVNRQLRLAEAPPPDANGKSIGPQVLSYLKGSNVAGAALRTLAGEPQELLDAKTGKSIAGRTLAGGASTFSPDSQWLLMADGEKAWLHHALDNDAARSFQLNLPGKAVSLAFSADSSQAIVATEGGRVSLWSTKNGRRMCPEILLPSEAREISLNDNARYVFVSGEAVSLWDTAPPATRQTVNFKKLSSFATWVSGDGRRAVAIPPAAIPATTGKGAVAVPVTMEVGTSAGSLTLHDLERAWQDGKTVARRTEVPLDGTAWLTRNGHFLLVWGGNEGAKIWNMEKRNQSDIFAAGQQGFRRSKYGNFYNGRGVVIVESAKDNTLGLVIEGARPDKRMLTTLFFDGTTGNELPDNRAIESSMVEVTAGLQHVVDLDGKATLARAASRLRRELPADARRAFFSDDEKLVAVLSTSASEEAIARPVLSELLFHSDLIGKTTEQLARDGRHYGFTAPAGRAWRLHVYDVATGACLLGEVTLPALAAFRWEGTRCIALSSEGRWTEIDLTSDLRSIEDLRDVAAVLTGRAIDPTTGSVAPVKQNAATLVKTWERLRQAYRAGWQIGAK